MEGSQRMHDKVVSFLQDSFMEDAVHWNEFTRDRAHVGSLSNAALLRVYWFAQGRLDTWVGSRLPKHLNYKKVEIVSKPFAVVVVVFADSLILILFCSVPGGGFFFLSIGRRPRRAGDHGGLVQRVQRDAFARDCVWRAGREMRERVRRGGVSRSRAQIARGESGAY